MRKIFQTKNHELIVTIKATLNNNNTKKASNFFKRKTAVYKQGKVLRFKSKRAFDTKRFVRHLAKDHSKVRTTTTATVMAATVAPVVEASPFARAVFNLPPEVPSAPQTTNEEIMDRFQKSNFAGCLESTIDTFGSMMSAMM